MDSTQNRAQSEAASVSKPQGRSIEEIKADLKKLEQNKPTPPPKTNIQPTPKPRNLNSRSGSGRINGQPTPRPRNINSGSAPTPKPRSGTGLSTRPKNRNLLDLKLSGNYRNSGRGLTRSSSLPNLNQGNILASLDGPSGFKRLTRTQSLFNGPKNRRIRKFW